MDNSWIPQIGGVRIENWATWEGGNLTCFDSDTGNTLWQYNTGAGVNAPPISYTLDGEEFIAVAAGGSSLWGSPKGDTIFIFGLPKKWEAPKK